MSGAERWGAGKSRTRVLSACQGKDALDAARARKVARRMRARGRIVAAYRCPVCREWHVGRPPPKGMG